MSLSALLSPPVRRLTVAQLTHLAKATGVNYSGKTKAVLAQSVLSATDAFKDGQKQPIGNHRILSIDMGIQNLAYCTLERSIDNSTPIIKEWRRLSVHDPTEPDPGFSSSELARVAYKLISTLILSKKAEEQPSHILIERQRWRSMGSRNILQWTVRVNTLEAMLWAILTGLKSENRWLGEVHAVDPARVASFWLLSTSFKDVSTGKKYTMLKQAKINLVTSWLQDETRIISGSADADATIADMLSRGTKPDERRILKKEPKFESPKLDDLADCLIQGLTWLEWLENRKLLAEEGVQAVEDLLKIDLDKESAQ